MMGGMDVKSGGEADISTYSQSHNSVPTKDDTISLELRRAIFLRVKRKWDAYSHYRITKITSRMTRTQLVYTTLYNIHLVTNYLR